MKTTLTWTGERMRNAGLLYQSYLNRAEVRDLDGRMIGEVLHLPSGYYQPRISGIMGEDCATQDQAHREVVALHRRFRT